MTDLRLGYFADFLSRNTLLVSGDEQELMRLSNVLREFAIGTNRRLLLGTVYVAETRLRRELWAELAEKPTNALTTPDAGVWSWRRTAEGWKDAADLIDGIAGAASPCHQFLDDDGNSMVMVSKGEYGDSWWSAHAS